MQEPAIKGTAFQAVVDDVRRLRETGRASAELLEARLEARDLQILERKFQPAQWYPMGAYRRMTELLLEVEGRGNPAYLRRRGEASARRLFEAGLYQQLNRGEEMGEEIRREGRRWTSREGNLVASLAGVIFNVSRWRFQIVDESRSRIEAEEAEAIPEVGRHAAEGFIGYAVGRLSRLPIDVRSERPTPDRMVFTLEVRS